MQSTPQFCEPFTTCTLAREASVQGAGIHSGAPCRVRVQPREAGAGIGFCRPGRPVVEARLEFVDAAASDRRTVLVGPEGERFEQIEHLMAALAAMGISDALVEQQGPEVPFLGGGSREFMEILRSAGKAFTGGRRPRLIVTRPICHEIDGMQFAAMPHDGLRLSCFVEYPGTVVGSMGFTLEITEEAFFEEAAPARTFAWAADIEKLRAAGLIKGGNLSNAVVFDENHYLNETLYFPNEVVRHKIIDFLGDLALCGSVPRGHFWAWRGGHRGHVLFARHLAQEFPVVHE